MTVYDSHPDGAYGAYPGAEMTFTEIDEAPKGGVTTWLGGLASLALMGGLALWSYDLVLRDVAGVPVIRALDGPMRVQPENPGGSQADYQGLAVNQVQADGIAAEAPAQIMLAPRPLDLSDATPPSNQLAELPAGAQSEAQVMQAVYAPQTPEPADTGLAVEALLSEIVAGEDAVADIVPTSVPGVALSPRPPARPEGVHMASLSAAPAAAEATRGFVDPATLTPGTRMVQFRAYQSAAEAEQAWQAIDAQFGDFMDGKSPVILPSSDGTTTFYRLRMTGFEDMAEAQRFCSVFLAADRDCVPVQF
ncbi:SPOR domain-containing protein [Tropicimonas sp. S265A]|uniref:SPOR domain-containing protein n=1 Tax=Tropicimonas sp. S265A TaxID=3415134 RepID=UPI003C7B0601